MEFKAAPSSIVEPQPFRHIKQPKPALGGRAVPVRRPVLPPELALYRLHLLLRHAGPVVPDFEDSPVVPGISPDPDMPPSPFVLNAMVEGIFHKRLQGKLKYAVFFQGLIQRHFIIQDILVADFLDLQITLNMAHLFLDGYEILAPA